MIASGAEILIGVISASIGTKLVSFKLIQIVNLNKAQKERKK